MRQSLLIPFVMMLCLSTHVDGSCDTGETNQTISVPCYKNMTVYERVPEEIRITPNCNWWQKLESFIFSDRCDTQVRTVYNTEKKNKMVLSYCDSVVCCPGYVKSENEAVCETGCPNGTYGENCTENCTCPDNAYSQCDMITGNCTCLPGKTGANCTDFCEAGYYGENCQHVCACQNSATCNIETGACNCTEPGWTGTYCDQRCNGTFGIYCSQNCTCNENQTCDPINGNCTCKLGRTGDDCSDECPEGKFGENCAFQCKCSDNTTELCDKVTGTCECKPGYIGHNCSDLCPVGYYGNYCSDNCSCVGTPHCDHRNGTCICIGKRGENCSNDCDTTHFGLDCLSTCSCSGDYFNGSCDPITGACHCMPGLEGKDCMTEEGNENGLTGVQDKNTGEIDVMTTDLMIGLIIGGCVCFIIIIIISGFVVQKRRKRKCFTRPDGKHYDNAIYSKAQETVILNESKQQTRNEIKEDISKNKLCESGKFKSLEDDSVNLTNSITNARSETGEKMPDLENEKKLCEIEKPDSIEYEVAKDDSADHIHEDSYSHQAVYELPKLNNIEDVDVVNDYDNSDHYSDVDSDREGETIKKRYSVVECTRQDTVEELPEDQNDLDEVQYDSLTHNKKENVNKLPTYSSFEQVRKESLDNSQESSDDPYDQVILKSQSKKKTLIRTDYDKFSIVNQTVDVNSSASKDNINSNAVNEMKNSIPVSAQSEGLKTIDINNDNTSYNSLDHTEKSCITNVSNNVYHTTKHVSRSSDIKATVLEDTDVSAQDKAKAISENVEESDPEYNTLDHTRKSFHAENKPENIYHSKELLSKSDTDKSLMSVTGDDTKTSPKGNSFVKQKAVSDEELVAQESEYNTLDHTGKSFRAQNTPENIYHSGSLLAKADTDNRSVSQNEDSSESTAILKSSIRQKSDSNDNAVIEDSEYNTLDHTGKSFHAVSVSDNIYNSSQVDPTKAAKKKLKALDISDPENDIEEDDSYSFCEIDDGDVVEIDIADDEKFIYEIPEISDGDLEASMTNNKNETTQTKAKAKSKQRQIDDYEAFELPFGHM